MTSNLATKADIHSLEQSITRGCQLLRGDISALEVSMTARFEAVDNSMSGRFKALEESTTAGFEAYEHSFSMNLKAFERSLTIRFGAMLVASFGVICVAMRLMI